MSAHVFCNTILWQSQYKDRLPVLVLVSFIQIFLILVPQCKLDFSWSQKDSSHGYYSSQVWNLNYCKYVYTLISYLTRNLCKILLARTMHLGFWVWNKIWWEYKIMDVYDTVSSRYLVAFIYREVAMGITAFLMAMPLVCQHRTAQWHLLHHQQLQYRSAYIP